MAPHIVSWSGNEPGISPVLPSRASIVSIDSILPDTRGSSLSTTEAKTKAIAGAVAEVNAAAEKEKQEANARATRAKVEASVEEARKEEEKRLEKERKLRAKQVEEQVAKQRAADKAAREVARASLEEQVAKQSAADKAVRDAARNSSVEEQIARQRAADKAAREAARLSLVEEQVARQRAADKAAREAARLSSAKAVAVFPRSPTWGSGSSWFLNKISQAAEVAAVAPSPKDDSSPSSKSATSHGSDASANPPLACKSTYTSSGLGTLRNAGGPSGSAQHPPIANSASRGPAFSLPTTSAAAIACATSNMSPAPLLSQEPKPGKENQEPLLTECDPPPMGCEPPLTECEPPRAFEYQARTSIGSPVTEMGEGRTSASTYLGADDSLLQHHKYFFNDGNITFLVDGTLYCIHRYFFSRDSEYFSTRFAQLGIRDHETLPTIVSLGDIERRDFEAFLSVIYPEDFEKHDLCYEEWVSVLHLSTRWSFASLRKLALASINPPTPHDQLLLARRYSIDDWVLPALSSLCERTAPLCLDEARQMNIEDVVIVATVRENIRNCTLRVDVVEIPRRVEAAQAGRLSSFEGVDVPPARPEAPPFGGGAAPSIRKGTPCLGGVTIPSTKPATPRFPVPSTTTVTPCFTGVATPSTVPETPGFVPSPRPMTPKFGDVTSPSPSPMILKFGDVAIPPPRPVTPKLGDVAIPSPGPATFMFSSLSMFGKKEEKTEPSMPRASTLGWGGFGSVVPSVTGSTGSLGWGSATGNNSPSHSAWQAGLGNKSGNTSTMDRLSGNVTADQPAGGKESPTANEAPPTESQEQAGAPTTREHLTVVTDVAAGAVDAVTVGPTTTGDSPEGEGVEGGSGDGEDDVEKPEDDEWDWPPAKPTKKKCVCADDGLATSGKKKKGKKGR